MVSNILLHVLINMVGITQCHVNIWSHVQFLKVTSAGNMCLSQKLPFKFSLVVVFGLMQVDTYEKNIAGINITNFLLRLRNVLIVTMCS